MASLRAILALLGTTGATSNAHSALQQRVLDERAVAGVEARFDERAVAGVEARFADPAGTVAARNSPAVATAA